MKRDDMLQEDNQGRLIIDAKEVSEAGFKLTKKAKKDMADNMIRIDPDSESDADDVNPKSGLANLDFSGLNSRGKKSKKKGKKRSRGDESGERFRATKARGDVVRKDGVEPYAFMTLNPVALRGKRRRTDGRLVNLLNAAKIGARDARKSKKKGKGFNKSKNKSHKKKR